MIVLLTLDPQHLAYRFSMDIRWTEEMYAIVLKKIKVIFQNECCKLLNLQPALCNIAFWF